MALMINDHCIACDACLPACPNQAIFDKRSAAESKGYRVAGQLGIKDDIYVIAYERCTECVGHFEEPQCASVCPIGECCVPDPERPESSAALLERARHLYPNKMIDQAKVWTGVRG
ncbi:MAG: 4Fe-4S dicluster domain-containing protein [Nitrospira sp.]|nr:4Fe-4S dicluster domain-containing protein [Nitrospira sp.]